MSIIDFRFEIDVRVGYVCGFFDYLVFENVDMLSRLEGSCESVKFFYLFQKNIPPAIYVWCVSLLGCEICTSM